MGGGYLGGLPLPGDCFFEGIEVLGGFPSGDRSKSHSVGAKQGGGCRLVLLLRHAVRCGVQLPNQGRQPHELAFSIVDGQAQIVDGVLGWLTLVGERQQGSFQQSASVGTGDARVGEHGDRGRRVVDTHAEGM